VPLDRRLQSISNYDYHPQLAKASNRISPSYNVKHRWEREEAAMPSCPECENSLDIEMDEVEEGDVVACEECGTEYEVVGVEPLELSRVGDELDEDEDEPFDEEEEEEE
jgi:alpha-aminoadipate carrier protein LysW